jgi:hypothetical protein
MKTNLNKVLDETKRIVTSEETKEFVKEVVKDTATSSVKSFGNYILAVIALGVAGICAIIYLISILL